MHFKKLNATQLSEIIGVQRSSVSHVINGRNRPSLEFVHKLVNEFPEVSFDWLINGEGGLNRSVTSVSNQNEVKDPAFDTNVSANSPSQTVVDTKELNSPSGSAEVTSTEPHETLVNQINTTNKKSISRVIIFYSDGTFEEIQSNNTE